MKRYNGGRWHAKDSYLQEIQKPVSLCYLAFKFQDICDSNLRFLSSSFQPLPFCPFSLSYNQTQPKFRKQGVTFKT